MAMAQKTKINFSRCWAEVDLDCITSNFSYLKKLASPANIIPVIKANAYGHGDIAVASALFKAGANYFAVASFEEAMHLRSGGIIQPILVFGYTDPINAKKLSYYNVHQCVFSLDYAKELSHAAATSNVKVQAHFKVDTGMSRIGFDANKNIDTAVAEIKQAATLPSLVRKGLFTHLATADLNSKKDKAYTKKQFETFTAVIEKLKQDGVNFEIAHCCNSAGTITQPKMHLDAVRPGIALYGEMPSGDINVPQLKPALTLKARIILVKEIDEGTCISYNCTYTSAKKMKLATLAIGYADGYPRPASNNAAASINGKAAPVVGRVCMDQTIVDVTDIPGVKAGDTAIITGDGIASSLSQLGALQNSMNYEILCGIAMRVPRLYIENKKPYAICDYLDTNKNLTLI